MATPSKRTRITNQTKEDIKKDSKKPGFKIEDAMKKHGLGMSTLYRILKEEPKTQSSRDDAKCVKGVTVTHAELEKRLVKWIVRTEKCTFIYYKGESLNLDLNVLRLDCTDWDI